MQKLIDNKKFSLFLILLIDYKFIEQFIIDIDKESDLNIVKIIKNNEKTIELNYDEILKNQNNFNILKSNISNELFARHEDFIYEVSEYFYNEIKFEKQAYLFSQDLFSILEGSLEMVRELNQFYQNYNTLQNFVVSSFIHIYSEAIDEIKNRYSVIIKDNVDTSYNLLSEKKETNTLDLLKKLFRGDEEKISIFKKYEKKLHTYNYIDDSFMWVKSTSSLVRFYNYLETKKMINNAFETNTKGIEYLNTYFSFNKGKSINSPYKRKLQNTTKNKHEFDFLDFK